MELARLSVTPLGVITMQNLFARFAKDESGATAIEYGLIASLISVAIIGAATTLGNNINNTFNKVAGNMK
jgi:pilus assembly protein Flp/PilA